jgi:hypothetical protein
VYVVIVHCLTVIAFGCSLFHSRIFSVFFFFFLLLLLLLLLLLTMNDLTYLRQRFGKRWKSSYELLLLPNEYEIAIDNFFEKFPTIIHDFVNCQLSPGRNHQPGARLPIGYGKILWMW